MLFSVYVNVAVILPNYAFLDVILISFLFRLYLAYSSCDSLYCLNKVLFFYIFKFTYILFKEKPLNFQITSVKCLGSR